MAPREAIRLTQLSPSTSTETSGVAVQMDNGNAPTPRNTRESVDASGDSNQGGPQSGSSYCIYDAPVSEKTTEIVLFVFFLTALTLVGLQAFLMGKFDRYLGKANLTSTTIDGGGEFSLWGFDDVTIVRNQVDVFKSVSVWVSEWMWGWCKCEEDRRNVSLTGNCRRIRLLTSCHDIVMFAVLSPGMRLFLLLPYCYWADPSQVNETLRTFTSLPYTFRQNVVFFLSSFSFFFSNKFCFVILIIHHYAGTLYKNRHTNVVIVLHVNLT